MHDSHTALSFAAALFFERRIVAEVSWICNTQRLRHARIPDEKAS